MTDCIRELNRIIYPTLKDWFECEKDLLYRESSYVEIINLYWKMYFTKLENIDNKSFFRKKITLRAIAEEIFWEIDYVFNEECYNPSRIEDAIDKIKEIIVEAFDSLIINPLVDYIGAENVKKEVFTSIRHYLKLNKFLYVLENEIKANDKLKFLIENYIKKLYINNLLLLDDEDYKNLNELLVKTKANISRIHYSLGKELDVQIDTHLTLKEYVELLVEEERVK